MKIVDPDGISWSAVRHTEGSLLTVIFWQNDQALASLGRGVSCVTEWQVRVTESVADTPAPAVAPRAFGLLFVADKKCINGLYCDCPNACVARVVLWNVCCRNARSVSRTCCIAIPVHSEVVCGAIR